MGSVPDPEDANVCKGISSYPWLPDVGVPTNILPDTSPVWGTSIIEGSENAGFVKLVDEMETEFTVGVMSNTAGVVVPEDVISNPEVPVNVGTGAPEATTLESSTNVTIEGSVGPTGSITTGGLVGPTSTTVLDLPPKGT